ncbi:hypothetical protein DFH06DRAFT_1186890 [Mycena polygramma]|nr:hypothetical protein DFH06DRAFT_1186890 [Mycena polygramma]
MMFNTKSLLFFTTAATLLSSVVGQAWDVVFFEPSAGGTNSCTGGGGTINGDDFGCHTIGLGSNVASFNIDLGGTVNPTGAEWVASPFSDNNCQVSLGVQLAPGACFSGSVGSFSMQTVPT